MDETDKKVEGAPEKAPETTVDTAQSSTSELEKLLKAVHDLSKHNEKVGPQPSRSEDIEKMERMTQELSALQKTVDQIVNRQAISRKGEFSEDVHITAPTYTSGQLKSLVKVARPAPNSDIEQIQKGNDDLYIAMTALNVRDPRQSKALMDYTQGQYPALYKAMSTGGSATGAEWIPTGFSSTLVDLVRLELRVAALHDRFMMPTNPYTFPVEGVDLTAYKVAENTGDDDAGTPATWIPASTPGTANLTFTAKKIGVRSVISTETTEDAVIAALPYVRGKIIQGLANAQENMVINGDVRTSGAIDGVTVGTDQRTTFDGYRRFSQAVGLTTNISGFTLADIRGLRTKMGKYGVNNNQLAFVVSVTGYNKLLSLSEVITIDKIGPKATILSGQLGMLDGIPIIVSEYVSDTLDLNGLNAGTSSKTEVILVRRDLFWFGDRREVTLKSRDIIETDQTALVALQRLDFKPLFPSSNSANKLVSIGVNVATS